MVQRRNSTQPAEDIGNERIETAAIGRRTSADRSESSGPAMTIRRSASCSAATALPAKLTARLIELASAPTHVKRPVDRLAIALGAQFNFFALEEVWQQPILLCGLPGAGTSTLAAKTRGALTTTAKCW